MSQVSVTKLEPAIDRKLQACRSTLRELDSVVVAFSGGVDSTFLLALAAETLGTEKVLAAMAVSTIFPQRNRKLGQQLARQIGVELIECETPYLADANFTRNPADRCYYCKHQLLSNLKKMAAERGYAAVVSGANADDVGDYRPGSRAEEQLGVRRPLQEVGLTKDEVRKISRVMNLPTWNAPAASCLATRIPYGQEITAEKLQRIEKAEEAMRELGFAELRVRDHGAVARIEVPAERIDEAVERRDQIVEAIKSAGYLYVALDLAGFRSGSMNDMLGRYLSEG